MCWSCTSLIELSKYQTSLCAFWHKALNANYSSPLPVADARTDKHTLHMATHELKTTKRILTTKSTVFCIASISYLDK